MIIHTDDFNMAGSPREEAIERALHPRFLFAPNQDACSDFQS